MRSPSRMGRAAIQRVRGSRVILSAAFLTGSQVIVRLLGMAYRVLLSRLLGPEGVGLLELASPALSIPMALISGASPALMRQTAQRCATGDEDGAHGQLRVARRIVLAIGALCCLVLLAFAGPFSRLIGDERVLPLLIAYAPCILLIGLATVYDGWFYGRSQVRPPATAEMLEQVMRVGSLAILFVALPRLSTTPLSLASVATIVAITSVLAQMGGVMYLISKIGRVRGPVAPMRPFLAEMTPISTTHVLSTALRSLNTVMVPMLLVSSGLTRAAALSEFGTLSGMVAPFLFFPLSLTGALATVLNPRIAANQTRGEHADMRRTVLGALEAACATGLPAAMLLFWCAPLVGRLYNAPLADSLLALMAPAALLLCLQQTAGSLLHGLGEQKRLLVHNILHSFLTLGLNLLFIGALGMGIRGYALTFLATSALLALLNTSLLVKRAHLARWPSWMHRPLVAAAAMAVVGTALRFVPVDGMAFTIALAAVSAAAYACAYAAQLLWRVGDGKARARGKASAEVRGAG